MDERSAQQLLLPENDRDEGTDFHKANYIKLSLRYALKITMWVIFLAWISVITLFPSDFMSQLFEKWILVSRETLFGVSGSTFLMFSAPILAITILSSVYIALFPKEYNKVKRKRLPWLRLWTFPVLVDGPFGVVSAAEFIGIFAFSAYILWSISAYAMKDGHLVSGLSDYTLEEKICLMLDTAGLQLGSIAQFFLGFLFLPISRGSSLLRLIDIPFEHATRYHIWLGHVTMMLFTLHGLANVVSWAIQGILLDKITAWDDIGVANLPGVISLLAGLLIWVTSLSPVRKNYFEMFFYTHQLYIVFVVFFALHVGDFIFYMCAGGILLFLMDRFLRFCQSRTTIDVLSAKCLPCGTVELTLSKPDNLRYNALGFVYLRVRELSLLQWHPFSVSSSPLDGRFHLTILIKVLGEWTHKLREKILSVKESPQKGMKSTFRITASVEGPYGHESSYYLQYEHLVLVAGGIGISPFIAILRDILHRVKDKKPCLPKEILLIWSVKRSEELSLLSRIDVASIFPFFSNFINIEIQTYVTQESEKSLEEGNQSENKVIAHFPEPSGRSMSSLVGTGNAAWSGIYTFSSTIGLILIVGLTEILYIRPFNITAWWLQGLVCIICVFVSIILFGGTVILLWHHWERSRRDCKEQKDVSEMNCFDHCVEEALETFSSLASAHYGKRPNLEAILNYVTNKWGNVDVGVLVSGPPGLQGSVAAECRSQNLRGRWNNPIFHFHSHSFDL